MPLGQHSSKMVTHVSSSRPYYWLFLYLFINKTTVNTILELCCFSWDLMRTGMLDDQEQTLPLILTGEIWMETWMEVSYHFFLGIISQGLNIQRLCY